MANSLKSFHVGLPFNQVLLDDFSTEIQWRPDFVLFFLLNGELTFQVNGKEHTIRTNDIALFMPYEIHSIILTSPSTRALTFLVENEFIQRLCSDINAIKLRQNILRFSEDDPVYQKVCSNLAGIIFNTMKTDTCSRLKMLEGMTAALITIIESMGEKHLDASESSVAAERVQNILNYVNRNYTDKVTLTSIAEHMGLHPQYFSAFFKEHFHMTFTDYMMNLRIGKSLPALINTKDSILDIALANGFESQKTYSAAFKRKNNVTPTEYRQQNAAFFEEERRRLPVESGQMPDYLSFFVRYWNKDLTTSLNPQIMQNHMTLLFNLNKEALPSTPNNQIRYLSVGRAMACLRNDMQTYLKEAKQDLHIKYLRMRDIFSDDLFVYYEEKDQPPAFNFQYLDQIFDFVLSIGLKPVPEIGFMPRHLASKKQYAGWQFRPNVSFPKSLKKWYTLITRFMEHLIDRYGYNEVRSWIFDFWASPNLNVKEGYWNESAQDFFLFYRVTYNAVKNVDEDLQLNSPNFSTPSGYSWYEDFFEYCKANEIVPSCISIHLYNCYDNQSSTSRSNFLSYSTDPSAYIMHTGKNTAIHFVEQIKALATKHGFGHLPIQASDWSSNFFIRDYTKDTCFLSTYIIYTSLQTYGLIDRLCLRSLSDINEDFFATNIPFNGGTGLMDFYGIRKASYYGYQMIQRLGSRIIEKSNTYILTRSSRGYQLLLFNYVYYDHLYMNDNRAALTYKQRYNIYESNHELVVHVVLTLPTGNYVVKKTILNRDAGSPYDLWLKSGAPDELAPETVNYLKKKAIPDIYYTTEEVKDTLAMEETIPPHGAVMIEFEKKRQK